MAIQNFDQLNSMSEKWYSKMDIPPKKRQERVDLSLLFGEIFGLFFDIIDDYKIRDLNDLEDWLIERLEISASNFVGVDNLAYIKDWSVAKAKKIVKTTTQYLEDESESESEEDESESEEDDEKEPEVITFEEFEVSVPKEEYPTSDVRAILLGIECASSMANYKELYGAYEDKMTNKVWITEADNRVRGTHQEVDHVDLPIEKPFVVGNSYMLFPGDTSYNAEDKEIANCRCFCTYYKK